MRILVAGAPGQLGRELCRQGLAKGCQMIAAARQNLDIRDAVSVREFVRNTAPDIIFNAAAWNAVDEAESQSAEAFRVNTDGAANLAAACLERSIPLVHYSTDYIFDGTKTSAYVEDDAANPINAYGRSKLAGEDAVRDQLEEHLIIRSSWIFSAHRHNFVKSMLKLGAEHQQVKVVADQTGKPTSAATIAEISLTIASNANVEWGTYHLAQPQTVSWHEFARAVFASAAGQGVELPVEEVIPIPSDDYPTVANRPMNSALDCHKLENSFELVIEDWHDALDAVVGDLVGDGFLA